MGYVLFSPIGNTDHIRGDHDGSWLHICRHFHEIVPFGRAEIETALRRTGPDGIRTPEELLAYLREFLEIICPGGPFDADYWRSYEAMNAHVCALLRVEGASDAK